MNARALPRFLLVFLIAGLFVGGCSSKSNPPAQPAVAETAAAEPDSPPDLLVDPPGPLSDSSPAAQPSDAPVMMVSAEKPLPASIKPSPALAEVIKLAESGLEENVMLAYVSNSPSAFGLGSEEIIFLTDIGVPGSVISAMIQKDHNLSQVLPPMMFPPSVPGALPPTNVFTTYQAMTPPAYAAPTQMEPPPAMSQDQAPPPEDPYAGYYDSLAPYGNWVNVDGYGVCWQPGVAVVNPRWRPYCDHGHWVYSNCGWYWYSDYSWGWCAFHYGRWLPHSTLGWCWVPGSAWAPAWVTWRYSNNYCAWAPVPPAPKAPLAPNAALAGNAPLAPNAPNAPHAATAPRAPLAPPALTAASFNVVPIGAMQDHHLSRYALPRDQASRVLGTTTAAANLTLRDNVPFNAGVPAEQVAAVTRTPVRPVSVRSMVDNSPDATRVEHLVAGARTPVPAKQPAAPTVATSLASAAQPVGNSQGTAAGSPPPPQTLPWVGRTQPGRSAIPSRSAPVIVQNQYSGAQNAQQEAVTDARLQQGSRPQQQTMPWQPADQVNRKPSTPIAGAPTQVWRPAEINRVNVQPGYQRTDTAARGKRPEDDAQVAAAQSQPAQVPRYYAAPAQPVPPPAMEVPRYAPAAPAGQQFSRPVSGVEPRASYAPPAQSAPPAAAPAPAPAQSRSAQSAPASAPARSDSARSGR